MTITTDNYEEYFYRYCEGELTPEQRAEVEAFAASHPDLAEELSLYDSQLKVQAEPVSYPDTDDLIHHHEAFVWWRWAAAACVVGALVGGAFMFKPDTSDSTPLLAQQRQESIATVEPGLVEKPSVKKEPFITRPVTKHTASVVANHQAIQTDSLSDSGLNVSDLVAESVSNDLAEQETQTENVVVIIEVPVIEEEEQLADVYVMPEPTLKDRVADFGRYCGDMLRSSLLHLRADTETYFAEKFNS